MSEQPEPASPASEDERIPLQGDDPQQRRRRLVSLLIVVLLLAAAIGGIFGLFLGRDGGLIAAAVVGVPLVYLVLYTTRRRVWIQGGALLVRTWGTRRLEVAKAQRIDLLITQVRGTRTIGILIGAEEKKSRAVKVDLATYQGGGGRELSVLPLRKLANALMNNTDSNGMVFAELLLAQLRSEAKGDPLEDRPLYRLAVAAPADKLAQRFTLQALSQFVASLD